MSRWSVDGGGELIKDCVVFEGNGDFDSGALAGTENIERFEPDRDRIEADCREHVDGLVVVIEVTADGEVRIPVILRGRAKGSEEQGFAGSARADNETDFVLCRQTCDFRDLEVGFSRKFVVEGLGCLGGDLVVCYLDCGHGLDRTGDNLCTPGKKTRFVGDFSGVRSIDKILIDHEGAHGMTSKDIWDLADLCITAGYFPKLVGQRFVLGLSIPDTGRVIIHREEESFRLFCACRVWLMSGRIRVLLGDSHVLPGDLSSGVRPPWTG